MKNAYEEFLRQCDSYVIACGDDENVRSLSTDKELIYYGFNENNEWTIKNEKLDEKFSLINLSLFFSLLITPLIPHILIPLLHISIPQKKKSKNSFTISLLIIYKIYLYMNNVYIYLNRPYYY